MAQGTERARRKRLSWESRCEIVWLIEQGMSPSLAAARVGQLERPAIGFGAGIARAGGPLCAIGGRRRGGSRSGSRPRASGQFWLCAGAARAAMSATRRASSCTSTRRSSAASGRSASVPSATTSIATAVLAAVPTRRDRRPLPSRLRRAAASRGRHQLRRLPRPRGPSTPTRGSSWSVCSPTTPRPTTAMPSAAAVSSSESRAVSPAPTGRTPTERAERFIQTLLNEWAYSRVYPSSRHRASALWPYLRWHTKRRSHSSLAGRPPISRTSHVRGQDS